MNDSANQFGGDWTVKKLEILEKYLNAYTTALKNQPFKLLYIDAFAGTGKIKLDQGSELSKEEQQDQEEAKKFTAGSAARALKVDNKPFDYFIFVEQDKTRCAELQKLRDEHPGRKIDIHQEEANAFLQSYLKGLRPNSANDRRGVLFLDPFATQVEWSTVKEIAQCKILDTWILFPTIAIARIMPKSQNPEDIDAKWAAKLDTVYGGADWRRTYSEVGQSNMFRFPNRDPGTEKLLEIYKEKLESLLDGRFLKQSVTLRSSKNSPLFEFMFFTGNPSAQAINISHNIAGHIMRGYMKND